MSTSHIRAIALVLMCAGLACSPGRTADLPEGLWDRDYDQRPGQSIPREVDALITAGLSPEEARRAAGASIIEWLTTRP